MTYQLPITPQQNRVLHLVAKGLSNKQIASELNISLATVKAHVFRAFETAPAERASSRQLPS